MIPHQLVSIIIGILSMFDVVVHIHFDTKKYKKWSQVDFVGINEKIPPIIMGAIVLPTVLSFVLVLLVTISFGFSENWLPTILYSFIEIHDSIRIAGLILLIIGISLHLWSRAIRGDMATSWIMTRNHQLLTAGPYSIVRHPSYLSYMLSFIGFFLYIPSIVTAILLIGIPGYYLVAKIEERMLLGFFGEEYRKYMIRTGRFVPTIIHRTRSPDFIENDEFFRKCA